jgi:predicted ester cyclase
MNAAASAVDWAGRYAAMCSGAAIGLVHDHATHHVTVETSLGRIYGRDDWATALLGETSGLEARESAGATAWIGRCGSADAVVLEVDQAVTHAGESPWLGPATGRDAVLSSTIIGLINDDRVYRAWRFVDHAAAARALGVDLDDRASALAAGMPGRGGIPWQFGEVRVGLGQLAPGASPPPPGLDAALATPCLDLQTAWNQRRFDLLDPRYTDGAALLDGPRRFESVAHEHPWRRVLDACPDGALFFERAVSGAAIDGETKVALLWRWVGTHTGVGFGAPCGRRLHVRGLTLLHVREGRITRERVVFDELGARRDALLRVRADETRP